MRRPPRSSRARARCGAGSSRRRRGRGAAGRPACRRPATARAARRPARPARSGAAWWPGRPASTTGSRRRAPRALAHGDQPVAAVQRRAQHDVGAGGQRGEGAAERPSRQARHVGRDDRDRAGGDVVGDAQAQRVGEPAAAWSAQAHARQPASRASSARRRGRREESQVARPGAQQATVSSSSASWQRRGLLGRSGGTSRVFASPAPGAFATTNAVAIMRCGARRRSCGRRRRGTGRGDRRSWTRRRRGGGRRRRPPRSAGPARAVASSISVGQPYVSSRSASERSTSARMARIGGTSSTRTSWSSQTSQVTMRLPSR